MVGGAAGPRRSGRHVAPTPPACTDASRNKSRTDHRVLLEAPSRFSQRSASARRPVSGCRVGRGIGPLSRYVGRGCVSGVSLRRSRRRRRLSIGHVPRLARGLGRTGPCRRFATAAAAPAAPAPSKPNTAGLRPRGAPRFLVPPSEPRSPPTTGIDPPERRPADDFPRRPEARLELSALASERRFARVAGGA